MTSITTTAPIVLVPDGTYTAKFVLNSLIPSSRVGRASQMRYDLEITSPMPDGRCYRVSDSWMMISGYESDFYEALVVVFDEEVDGLLDEDGTVDIDLLIGKEVEVTVGNYLKESPRRLLLPISYVVCIDPIELSLPVRKQSSPTRRKTSSKSKSVAKYSGAFAKTYPGIAAL